MKIYLIGDESGAKGYSDNAEREVGELGVFAGFLLQQLLYEKVSNEVGPLMETFSSDQKLHIADLPPNRQDELRNSVFEILRRHSVACIYEAVYVKGFQQEAIRIEQMTETARSIRKSGIKISENTRREMLHVQLFEGLLAKAIAFSEENNGTQIEIVLDRMDAQILQRFERVTDDFFGFADFRQDVTGFDPIKKQVVKGEVRVSTAIPADYQLRMKRSGITILNTKDVSGLTLAADVLSNSVHYHLRTAASTSAPLNTVAAISSHPLCDLFYGNDGDTPWASDVIFARKP
jgi:hypothetical protein